MGEQHDINQAVTITPLLRHYMSYVWIGGEDKHPDLKKWEQEISNKIKEL